MSSKCYDPVKPFQPSRREEYPRCKSTRCEHVSKDKCRTNKCYLWTSVLGYCLLDMHGACMVMSSNGDGTRCQCPCHGEDVEARAEEVATIIDLSTYQCPCPSRYLMGYWGEDPDPACELHCEE